MFETEAPKPETRQRVLESAVAVFAERGFRDTTIHEICLRAGANIAAVNYYFGSKDDLYAEAWRGAFRQSLATHRRDGGVPADAGPEERLRGRIKSLIRAMTDPSDRSFLIAQKEMANPTLLLREVQRECISPLREETAALVREVLGPRASEEEARFCVASIMSQCFGVARWMRARQQGLAPVERAITIGDTDAYAEHVARFSLAGMRAIREQSAEDGDKAVGSLPGAPGGPES